MRYLWSFLAATLFASVTAQAEMRIETTDGRSFTVPVEPQEIRSIEFSTGGEAQQFRFDGVWKTNWGRMTLKRSGAAITGNYESDGGLIKGEVKRNRLIGYWSEHKSGQPCDTALDGRKHWGRVVMTLSAEGTAFRGKWDYCHNDPAKSTQDAWTATRE